LDSTFYLPVADEETLNECVVRDFPVTVITPWSVDDWRIRLVHDSRYAPAFVRICIAGTPTSPPLWLEANFLTFWEIVYGYAFDESNTIRVTGARIDIDFYLGNNLCTASLARAEVDMFLQAARARTPLFSVADEAQAYLARQT
jgi:hypothetical protein